MIRLLLLLLLLLIPACDTQAPSPIYIQPSITPVAAKSIVLVTGPGCVYCVRQKELLEHMKRKDRLRGVSIKEIGRGDPQYPAVSIPTMYICSDGKCTKLVGLQTERTILKYLK